MGSGNRFPFHWLLTVVGSFSHQAYGKVTIDHAGTKTTYTFEIDELDWKDLKLEDQRFSKLSLKGVEDYAGIIFNIGAPEIPVIRLYAQGSVQVRPLQDQRILVLEDKKPLVPVQKPREKIPNLVVDVAYDLSIYESSADYPSAGPSGSGVYEVISSGSIRGVDQNLVTLYPVVYSPKTSTYKIISKFEVVVDAGEAQVDTRPENFAMIVGSKFAESKVLKKLEEHKTKLGFEVTKLVVSPGEKADSIRSRLKQLYKSTNLRYGLIVGDHQDVPGKDSDIIAGVTDHYYRALDLADYKKDINGPDIGIGRISVANEAQLENVVGKMLRYESGQFNTNEWLQRVSWLATDDRWQIAEGSHNYVINSYAKMRGFSGVFPESQQKGGDQLYAITHRVDDATVVRTIGQGRSIINYSGHGSQVSWAGPTVTQEDVRNLSDPSALPFVISNACITGDFRITESFGETWQRHPFGAIAFLGSMDSSYWDEDDILERRMFDGIFKKGIDTFGQTTETGLSEVWRHYGGKGYSAYYWETYVLFGDPSQSLRWAPPRFPEGPIPTKILVGTAQTEFFLTTGGKPLAGARVAATSISGTPVSTFSDAQGKVRLDLKALTASAGTITVMISGRNLMARQETITVVVN